jgi:hypothetical protein
MGGALSTHEKLIQRFSRISEDISSKTYEQMG